MKIFFVSIGSKGDIHPHLGIGRELARRGHQITVLSSAAYQASVEDEGFEFIELVSAAKHREIESDRRMWQPRRGLWAFYKELSVGLMRRSYELLAQHATADETLIVAPPYAVGARIANEKLRIPLATIHLHPFLLRSVYEDRRTPAGHFPKRTPRWVKSGIFDMQDWIADRTIGRPIAAFRAELGLPRAAHLLYSWWNSPDLVLGLFPEWYAKRAYDWPAQLRLTDFPRFDGHPGEISPELNEFLASGEPPILFTPGSANNHGREFFAASVAACQQLGKRAILATGFLEQIPPSLPPGVRHERYVPFSTVLPRLAAIVHHGGIGTAAQALSAGIPQIVMPMGFDQPDNAWRLEKLGVSRTIYPRRYTANRVARNLAALLNSDSVQQRCAEVARKFTDARPCDAMCDHLESVFAPPLVANHHAS